MNMITHKMAWYRQDMNTELDSCDVPTKDRSLGLVVNDSGPLVGVVCANYPTDNDPETPLGVMNLGVACPRFGLVTVPKLIAYVETSYTQTLEGTIASHGKTIGIFDRSPIKLNRELYSKHGLLNAIAITLQRTKTLELQDALTKARKLLKIQQGTIELLAAP